LSKMIEGFSPNGKKKSVVGSKIGFESRFFWVSS
jgi:hypothetical protein